MKKIVFPRNDYVKMRSMTKWLNLLIGGILGTVARYALAGATYRVFGTEFPYGTLVVNLSGCFLIGLFAALADTKFLIGPNGRMLLMIGFCGAFTTFSTYILESANLIRDGETMRALLNVVGSVVLGFIAFRVGIFAGEAI